MNKKELIAEMKEKSNLSKGDIEKALSAFIETVQESVRNGESIQLLGFGTFLLKDRAARIGTNPKTKEKIEIPATKVPVFKAGKEFKEKVNR